MKHAFLILLLALSAFAQSASSPASSTPGKIFDELADSALMAMTKRAEELKIKGVDLIAAFSGGPSESDLKVSQAGLEVLAGKL
jgi:hypothetical protein